MNFQQSDPLLTFAETGELTECTALHPEKIAFAQSELAKLNEDPDDTDALSVFLASMVLQEFANRWYKNRSGETGPNTPCQNCTLSTPCLAFRRNLNMILSNIPREMMITPEIVQKLIVAPSIGVYFQDPLSTTVYEMMRRVSKK